LQFNQAEDFMSAKNLRELFVEELRDTYDAEKRITKALPKMIKAAQSEDLQEALRSHLGETETQISRLEQVFAALDEPVRGKKCDGMEGILEEGKKAVEELEEGPLLDAAIIAGSQKVEHYEIASYGTLAYMAELLGESEAKSLLGQTLDEEKSADKKLNAIATTRVNLDALRTFGDEDEEEEDAEEARRTTSTKGSGRASNQRSARSRK
jgi:ferritin-like metal-binding protein YciE